MATLSTADAPVVYTRDPDDVLDYSFDWTAWLAGDVVNSITILADPGITAESPTFTGTTTTVWISGGTQGSVATVTHRITTVAGRSKDLTMTFRTMNK